MAEVSTRGVESGTEEAGATTDDSRCIAVSVRGSEQSC